MMDKTITIEEAHGIAKRFIDGHFNNPGEKPRIRIPADPDHDDDLRLRAFIDQHAALLADAERLRALLPASYPPAPVSDLGDAVADMFDQLVAGNWTDDHGHPVASNVTMLRLKERMNSLMRHIEQVRQATGEEGA